VWGLHIHLFKHFELIYLMYFTLLHFIIIIIIIIIIITIITITIIFTFYSFLHHFYCLISTILLRSKLQWTSHYFSCVISITVETGHTKWVAKCIGLKQWQFVTWFITANLYRLFPETGPGFFLRGGAPLRNGVTDWWSKQILKANTRKKASSQGVCTPCPPPLDLPLVPHT